jgi:hypothetical protein
MSSCNIKVVARFRPFNENEKKNQDKAKEAHGDFEVRCLEGTRVEMKLDKQNYNFSFDCVYDTETRQADLYVTAAKPSIE